MKYLYIRWELNSYYNDARKSTELVRYNPIIIPMLILKKNIKKKLGSKQPCMEILDSMA